MYTANQTVLLGARPQGRIAADPCDRTAHLARIIRHSMKAGPDGSRLDRAIRSVVTPDGSLPDREDVEFRAGFLARRLNAVLAEQDVHRETVVG
jgi:hypothetical protein